MPVRPRHIPILLLPLLLTACLSATPAAPDRATLTPVPIPPDAWPERRTEGILDAAAVAPLTLSRLRVEYRTEKRDDAWYVEADPHLEPVYEVLWSQPAGHGIVRALRFVNGSTETDTAHAWGHVTSATLLEFVSFPPEGPPAPEAAVRPYGEHEWLPYRPSFLRFLKNDTSPPAGLLVHLHGLAPTRQDERVLRAFLRSGWWALYGSAIDHTGRGITLDVGPETDPARVGRWIASRYDGLLAERAYAIEATIRVLTNREPALRGAPIVIAGYSAGAMAAVPAAAYRPNLYDALVIVGGGGDLLGIVLSSDLRRVGPFEVAYRFGELEGRMYAETPFGEGEVSLRWWPEGVPETPDERLAALPEHGKDPQPPADFVRAVREAYLDATRLDPAKTAPALTAHPVLMLTADADRWVPSWSGDLLYDRLGRPERWTLPFGHLYLFFRLPSFAERIVRWAEAAVQRAEPIAEQTTP